MSRNLLFIQPKVIDFCCNGYRVCENSFSCSACMGRCFGNFTQDCCSFESGSVSQDFLPHYYNFMPSSARDVCLHRPRTPPINNDRTMSAAGNVNQSQRHDSKTPPRDFRVASQTFQYPPLKPLPTPLSISKNPPKSPCGHMNSGQELCYLCHQRQTRNIPVDFSEERKRREREEEMLLSQYQEMKNTEAFLKQQVRYSKARHVCCELNCHFCVTF